MSYSRTLNYEVPGEAEKDAAVVEHTFDNLFVLARGLAQIAGHEGLAQFFITR